VAHFNTRENQRIVRYERPDRIQIRLKWKHGTESWVVIVRMDLLSDTEQRARTGKM
jgi:hypothetical protein